MTAKDPGSPSRKPGKSIRGAATTLLASILDALVGADARPQALLALAPAAVMLAYLRSPAFLARALLALVGADARPQALLAPAPAAVMLAYLRSAAFLALAPAAVMLAFARRHSCRQCFCKLGLPWLFSWPHGRSINGSSQLGLHKRLGADLFKLGAVEPRVHFTLPPRFAS